jgi:hypothetical protein
MWGGNELSRGGDDSSCRGYRSSSVSELSERDLLFVLVGCTIRPYRSNLTEP